MDDEGFIHGVVVTNLQFHFLSLDAPMVDSVVMVSPEHIPIIASPGGETQALAHKRHTSGVYAYSVP